MDTRGSGCERLGPRVVHGPLPRPPRRHYQKILLVLDDAGCDHCCYCRYWWCCYCWRQEGGDGGDLSFGWCGVFASHEYPNEEEQKEPYPYPDEN